MFNQNSRQIHQTFYFFHLASHMLNHRPYCTRKEVNYAKNRYMIKKENVTQLLQILKHKNGRET